MARKLLRKIALDDGREPNQCKSFAECCINILQHGCRYNKGVEKHIKRLLKDREEKVCQDVLMVMERPHRQLFQGRKDKKSPAGWNDFTRKKKRRRWKSPPPDSRQYDRKRLYYVDKRPHEYNRHRPATNKRGRGETYNKPKVDQMGRMEFKRRRTHARVGQIQGQPEGKTNGTPEIEYRSGIPNFISNES